jgi:two-component system, LytTR family, response regulator
VTLRAVIVDDEPVAVRRLAALLRAVPELELVATASGGEEGLAAIERTAPDLVFLDIEMPRVTGLMLARRLGRLRDPVLVFVTAHSAHAVEAFGVAATDYLLKPVEPVRLQATVARVRALLAGRRAADRLVELESVVTSLRAQSEGCVWVPDGAAGRQRIAFDQLVWLQAEGDYVRLHTPARSHLVRDRISRFEQRLPDAQFLRVHRSAIVRLAAIRSLRRIGDRLFELETETGAAVPVGRRYARAVVALLQR